MFMRTLLNGIALALSMAGGATAQEGPVTETGPITIGASYSLQSEALAEAREVLVALPPDYATSTKRYPVVYLLDAQNFSLFQYAYGQVNALATLDEMPEVILVGVPSANRRLDMTPAAAPDEGRADAFIAFFRDELQDFVAAQFRTEPYSIVIGHSLGALFAMHTLAQQPDTFDAYIALSPSLWFEDGKVFHALKDRLASGAAFDNALFASLADEDGDMQQYYEDLVALLDDTKPAGLEYTHRRFPDEGHESTTLPGIHHGLLSVYARWVPPASVTTFDALQAHYRDLSAHYGYPIAIPPEEASGLGLDLLDNGAAAAALEVFEYSLANLAQGPIEYHQMGLALRELGRLDEALAAFENAIAVGEGSPFYAMFARDRDAIARELQK